MTDELSKALLKQNGLEAGTISEASLDDLRRRLTQARKRAARMKWRMIITWMCFAIFYLGYGLLSRYADGFSSAPSGLGYLRLVCMMLAIISFPAAIIFTISWYAMARGASLGEINLRLANLERLLSEKERRDEAQ